MGEKASESPLCVCVCVCVCVDRNGMEVSKQASNQPTTATTITNKHGQS